MYVFTTTHHEDPARKLQHQLGVSLEAVWRIGDNIRKYMAKVENDNPSPGIFEIDETMIGGKRAGQRERGTQGKTAIFGIV